MLESKFKKLRSLVGRGLLAGTLLATGLGQMTVSSVHAANPTITLVPITSPATPSGNNHAVNDTWTMAVVAQNSPGTRGWQVQMTWTPSVVQITDYQIARFDSAQGAGAGNIQLIDPQTNAVSVFGDSFLKAYATAQSPAMSLNTGDGFTACNVVNAAIGCGTAGTFSGAVSDALAGTQAQATLPGPSGNGTLMILQFKAVGNGVSALHFVGGATGTFMNNVATTLVDGTAFVGPTPTPNLATSAATTTGVSGTPTSFNVGFTVTNNGSGNMTSSGSVSVTASNTTSPAPANATQTVPALPFTGTNSQAFTAGPFSLASGQTLSNVTITVSCGTNSPCTTTGGGATTAYSFSAFTSSGTTPVSATNAGVLQLTAPAAQSLTLLPGTTSTSNGTLTVLSNLTSFQVTISGDNNGFLTEAAGTPPAYVATPKKLSNPLQASAVPTPTSGNTGTAGLQSITGTPALFVSGTLQGQAPSGGVGFATTFSQFDGFNDPSVAAPHQYFEVVTFAAAGTF